MEGNVLKVAIYTRVSTEEQKRTGFSLKGQEDELHRRNSLLQARLDQMQCQ